MLQEVRSPIFLTTYTTGTIMRNHARPHQVGTRTVIFRISHYLGSFIEFCRREQADMLLPVGGGSVIDTAKAIAAGVLYEGDFWDFYIGKAKVTKALKVAVVLTIPAAGSEGSGNTVITKLDGLQKLSLRVPEVLRPIFSIMNPELTYTLPPFQTACGVADMMAHIMERYFTNTQEVEIGDRLCEGVLMAIINEAPKE